ncbi:radical SAM protein [Bacteroides sp. 51]|uniref:radical SAM protein n=1 Tax=Bacteroides sp. 51 TaxID=2302938 RepID=UPI0013D52E6B|nr:radical SAM protein [Bacteroides sp. 51]NDV84778.1 radical SAM protein [Bacteroides sp. 51]
MKIGLIDVDGHNFPNIALMKLSAYHKGLGDTVDWYSGIEHFDCVYMSKVFAFTPDDSRVIQADEVIKGGSGYKLFNQWLPDEVEHICPDYSLYPTYSSAYGFLTRGCVNKCSFCIVPRKEGTIRKHADITEFLDGRKSAILMDNNVIASDWGLSQIEKIISLKIKVDFNQGIDCRLIARDKSIAKLLKRVSWIRYIRMAYDNSAITEEVKTAIAYLKEAGIPAYKMFFYMLVKDGQIEDAEMRALNLDLLGCTPFAMPYRDLDNDTPPTEEQKRFARWVNCKAVFNSCTYGEYKG